VLGLDEVRLIREVLAGVYSARVREDFKNEVRGGVNGTQSFFINGERYDGAHGLEPLLAALAPKPAYEHGSGVSSRTALSFRQTSSGFDCPYPHWLQA